MSSKRDLGGNRLGSGGKNEIKLHGYERSTHNLDYKWRSSMSSGTLVPFMTEVALPGSSFQIKLNSNVMTHPTVGPLFGSYKIQLDVFQIPIRLYNGKLHQNANNVGMKMSSIRLPQIELEANGLDATDNSQIEPSSIFSYLNIRGLGKGLNPIKRQFNAIPYLGYWDIYYQYYANKQEKLGAVIHNNQNTLIDAIRTVTAYRTNGTVIGEIGDSSSGDINMEVPNTITVEFTHNTNGLVDASKIYLILENRAGAFELQSLAVMYNTATNTSNQNGKIKYEEPSILWDEYSVLGARQIMNTQGYQNHTTVITGDAPKVRLFELDNIVEMRELILSQTMEATGGAIKIDKDATEPYSLPLQKGDTGKYSKQSNQEGLALKTFQSDLFNNWIMTERIDGSNGVNAIASVSTVGNVFTIDTLNLTKKVYNMLTRIASGDGTYDDWVETIYDHQSVRRVENPIYLGGLSKELTFQEVISNAQTQVAGNTQPLGTMAGRGVMTDKHKGGYIDVRVDEPSYIMGIISITPRIDYSQGNKWDVNLKTMDDFHKPALDEIGYQDLITDQMAYWDTDIDTNGKITYKSAGKVPAWINYTTNVNVVRGNFAKENNEMFMVLNRRYEKDPLNGNIKDLTTYIDPSKFNNIFADTRIDAQNFWAQINVGITKRSKMSARQIPNL